MEKVRERFTLLKVKLLKNEALDVHFVYQVIDGATQYDLKDHIESPIVPHPDLRDRVTRLNTYVARIYALTFFRDMILQPEFEATPKQSEAAERYYQSILERIKVTGVCLSGNDKHKGCIITAVFMAENRIPMALNTHRIRFSESRYGFEEELGEICEEIESECFEYLYNNKQAQLDLFPEGEE